LKRKLKIYTSYGKQDNEILSDEKMFSSQKELDCYLDEAYNTEELVGKFDFNDTKTQSEYIYSDGGDWDDQTGFTYELVSYESELNEINKEIEKLKAKTENLMKEYN
jgi:hypothetical protein